MLAVLSPELHDLLTLVSRWIAAVTYFGVFVFAVAVNRENNMLRWRRRLVRVVGGMALAWGVFFVSVVYGVPSRWFQPLSRVLHLGSAAVLFVALSSIKTATKAERKVASDLLRRRS